MIQIRRTISNKLARLGQYMVQSSKIFSMQLDFFHFTLHKESGFSQMFGVEMGEIHQCGTHGSEKLSITLKILDQSYWNNIELSTFPLCSALK